VTATAVTTGVPAVSIGGSDDPSLAAGLVEMRIDESVQGLHALEATFGNQGPRDGAIAPLYFDRRTLDFGKEIAISAAGGKLFAGKITGIEGSFPEGGPLTLTVFAEDRFQDLRMTRRTRAFADMTDQAVISQIASDHGLTADVALDGPTHRVLAQLNQSDLAFVRSRARALGAELWIADGKLSAKRRPDRGGATVKLGYPNELRRMAVMADLAGQRTEVGVSGWDVAGKAALTERATDSVVQGELENGDSGAAILQRAFGARKETVQQTVPVTGGEARARAEAAFRQRARRFVSGRGVAATTPDLRVGALAQLSGLGPLFSGRFYVTEVRHLFDTRHGLRSELSVERPGLGRP
jgi:phage protein D